MGTSEIKLTRETFENREKKRPEAVETRVGALMPLDVERETMDVDVLIVGGGAAGLSCALALMQKIEDHNTKNPENKLDPMVAVLEKGQEVGAHSVSGAVLNPSALKELLPNYKELGCPIDSEVKKDAVYFLTQDSAIKMPITPPPFQNHGNYLISLSKFNRWLGQQCESKGVNIFPGFAAVEVIYENDKVVGVRTGDKGLDKNGQPKANFEPGLILKSKVVVFAEGPRGSLFRKHARKLNLREGKNPEVFEEGVKEIIQCPPGTIEAGQVIHTLGFPLKESIGGTFLYTLSGDRVSLGLVAYLDSRDPLLDPHRELQRLKTHPFLQKMLAGGQVIAYGGKTLPAGGWFSIPQLYGDGWVVCGDSASMVDVQKLKGIHLGMKAGMCAAESIFEGLSSNSDFSKVTLKSYEKKLHASFVKSELYRVRNFHQTLSKGIFASLPLLAIQEITGGRGLSDNMSTEKDSLTTEKYFEVWGPAPLNQPELQLPKPDGKLFFDKLSSVYLTRTSHDEDSPNHLILQDGDICRTVCEPQYKSPCVPFCPASVYEMLPSTKNGGSGYDLQINYTNCIHCKTCDIKCPFDNIEWTAPEGGGGPKYTET